MLVAENDRSCDVKEVRKGIQEIGKAVKSARVLKNANHEYFWYETRLENFLEWTRSLLERDLERDDDDQIESFSSFESFADFKDNFFETESATYSHIATVSAAAIASFATIF